MLSYAQWLARHEQPHVKQIAAANNVEALGAALVEAGCQSQFQRLAANTAQD